MQTFPNSVSSVSNSYPSVDSQSSTLPSPQEKEDFQNGKFWIVKDGKKYYLNPNDVRQYYIGSLALRDIKIFDDKKKQYVQNTSVFSGFDQYAQDNSFAGLVNHLTVVQTKDFEGGHRWVQTVTPNIWSGHGYNKQSITGNVATLFPNQDERKYAEAFANNIINLFNESKTQIDTYNKCHNDLRVSRYLFALSIIANIVPDVWMNFIKTNKEWLEKHTSYKDHYKSSIEFGDKQALEALNNNNNNNAKLQKSANLRTELQQYAKPLQMQNSLLQEGVQSELKNIQVPLQKQNTAPVNRSGDIKPRIVLLKHGSTEGSNYFTPSIYGTEINVIGANEFHLLYAQYPGGGQASTFGYDGNQIRNGLFRYVPFLTTQDNKMFNTSRQDLFQDLLLRAATTIFYFRIGGDLCNIPTFDKNSYGYKNNNIDKNMLTAQEKEYIEKGGELANLGAGAARGIPVEDLAIIRSFALILQKVLQQHLSILPSYTNKKYSKNASECYQKCLISIADRYNKMLKEDKDILSKSDILMREFTQCNPEDIVQKIIKECEKTENKDIPHVNDVLDLAQKKMEQLTQSKSSVLTTSAVPLLGNKKEEKRDPSNNTVDSKPAPIFNNFFQESFKPNTSLHLPSLNQLGGLDLDGLKTSGANQPTKVNPQSRNHGGLDLSNLSTARTDSALSDRRLSSSRSMLSKTTAYKLPKVFQDFINGQIPFKRSMSMTTEQGQKFPSLVASKPNLDLEYKNIKTLQDTKVSNYDKYCIIKNEYTNIQQIFTTKLEFKIAEGDKHKGKIRISVGYEAKNANITNAKALIEDLKKVKINSDLGDSGYENCIYIKPDDLPIAWQTLSKKEGYEAYPANHYDTITKFNKCELKSECINEVKCQLLPTC